MYDTGIEDILTRGDFFPFCHRCYNAMGTPEFSSILLVLLCYLCMLLGIFYFDRLWLLGQWELNAMSPSHPLTPAHCDTIDCALKQIQHTQELIDKCTNCGLDTSAAQEELNRQRKLAESLKQQFFPNRP